MHGRRTTAGARWSGSACTSATWMPTTTRCCMARRCAGSPNGSCRIEFRTDRSRYRDRACATRSKLLFLHDVTTGTTIATHGSMDHIRSRPKHRFDKRVVIAAVGAFALLGGGIALARIDFSTQRVERGRVTIDTVKRGTLEVKVRANGQLVPKNVEYIAAEVT